MIENVHDDIVYTDIVDNDDDDEPLTPADHGKVPGSGKTVVPVPGKQMLLFVPSTFWKVPGRKMLKSKKKSWTENPPGIVKGVRAM